MVNKLYLTTIFLILISFIVTPCCTTQSSSGYVVAGDKTTRAQSDRNDPKVIQRLKRSTIALFARTGSTHHIYCAGVWLDDYLALTAYHCVEPDWIIDEDDPDRAKLIDEAIIGSTVRFKTFPEVWAAQSSSTTMTGHKAVVVSLDRTGDLALLRSTEELDHDYVDIAPEPGMDAERVHVIGHPRDFPFNYSPGIIGGTKFRTGPYGDIEVPMYDVIGFAWYGNSGGGVFNSMGELLGIISSIQTIPSSTTSLETPRTGLAIHTIRIRQLLADNHVAIHR